MKATLLNLKKNVVMKCHCVPTGRVQEARVVYAELDHAMLEFFNDLPRAYIHLGRQSDVTREGGTLHFH